MKIKMLITNRVIIESGSVCEVSESEAARLVALGTAEVVPTTPKAQAETAELKPEAEKRKKKRK